MRISVTNSRELQGVIAAMKTMDRETAKAIRKYTKPELQAEWQQAVREHASTPLDHAVLADTARLSISDQNVTLKSASVGRSLAGGLSPKADYAAVEFGADRSKVETYTATSRKGKAYRVTRHTRRQLPPIVAKGRVVYPAAADIIPRIASLWVQTVVRTFYETIERAGS